jgi:poly-gamma-glutamate system protein
LSLPALAALASVALAAAFAVPFARHASGLGRPDAVTRLLDPDLDRRAEMARSLMQRAEELIRIAKLGAGIGTDPGAGHDPSGLIGAELTPLVTTIGSLESKRTAANPEWARALTLRLRRHGVEGGSVVAAGFSGSFPGLNLAVIAACQALGADLAAVSSVTASTWGATEPGFTWPEIEARLVREGIIRRASIAVSLGGARDVAADLEPEGRALAESVLVSSARALGIAVLRPVSLEEAVAERMALFRRYARGRPIALYVNVGGTDVSLGTSETVLRLRNGFLPGARFDSSPGRGLIARFAEQGRSRADAAQRARPGDAVADPMSPRGRPRLLSVKVARFCYNGRHSMRVLSAHLLVRVWQSPWCCGSTWTLASAARARRMWRQRRHRTRFSGRAALRTTRGADQLP